jgi:outer membrane protein assembly factor BamB
MIAGYYAHDDGRLYLPAPLNAHLTSVRLVVVTLSGIGGGILRTFDIETGVLLLEKQIHPPQLGHRAEPHTLGKHVVFGDSNSTDIYVLTNGYNFARMNRETGETRWNFASPDARFAIHPNCFSLC